MVMTFEALYVRYTQYSYGQSCRLACSPRLDMLRKIARVKTIDDRSRYE